MPHFEFTVFVDGIDLFSDPARGALEQLARFVHDAAAAPVVGAAGLSA